MASASAPKFVEFSPEYDEWNLYIERLDQYFAANKIKPEEKELKTAILINSISPSTYKLLRDLTYPDLPKSKTYEQLCELLQGQFTTQINVWRERRKFYETKQDIEESVSEWYARVKGAATNCLFGADLTKILRDRFITGMRHHRILDRICEESHEAKLEDIIKMATKIEGIMKTEAPPRTSVNFINGNVRDSKFPPQGRGERHLDRRSAHYHGNSASADRDRVNRRNDGRDVNSKSKQQNPVSKNFNNNFNKNLNNWGNSFCKHCNSSNHSSQACYFKNSKCNLCKKVGHISRICRSKKVNYLQQKAPQVQEFNLTEGRLPDCFNENILFMEKSGSGNLCESKNNCKSEVIAQVNFNNTINPFQINVKINNKMISMIMDTGSSISTLSFDTYLQNFSNCRLKEDDTELRVYDGSTVRPKGFIEANVTYRDTSRIIQFYVVNTQGPGLLGRDWINSFQIRIEMVNMMSAESRVNRLIDTYKNLFNDKLGKFKYAEISIELEKNVRPIYCKYRSVPLAYKDKVEQELTRLENEGVIISVESSDWATPLVPILKEGGKIRLCGDYKTTVNRNIKDFKYPLPRIEEIFAKLNKGIHFSKIDLVKAYNQFVVDEDTSKILTWNTSKGLYRVLRLPFGIKTASSIFQKSIEGLFQGMSGVVNFLDDIVVTGKDLDEHLSNLEKVFSILQNAGLTVQKDKCEFFKSEIEYLGHKISKEGIRKSDGKIKAITEAPEPKNISEVRSFLGLVNYYHKFIPNASEILNPIYDLLKVENNFNWDRKCSISFNKVKDIIARDLCLAHFNPDLTIYLTTDASNVGISGVISHIIEGKERIIACTSRTLTPAETKYSTIQKEALSIRYSVGKFYQYLIGHFFTLRTDHKPLVALFGENKGLPQMAANRLQRWALYLSEFNYKIEYIKGKDNPIADFMSRLPRTVKILDEEPDEGLYINFAETVKEWPIDNKKVKEETQIDPELKIVLEYVQRDKWPHKIDDNLKPYYNIRSELTADKEILMWGHRIVVPKALKKKLLAELHAGHFGISRTKTLARSLLYWPGIDRDIEHMIKGCLPCLENKQDPPKNQAIPWPKSEEVFERVHCDFLHIHNKTALILCDSYSKWVEVLLMKSTTSIETEEKLREVFARMGLPKTLVSDNGPPFSSISFRKFLESNGITHVTSAPYHPQSNGAAENAVKTFKNKLLTALSDPRNGGESLQTLISRYLLTYRNTKHPVTGFSPAERVFNRPLRTRLSLLKEARPERNPSHVNKIRRKFKVGEAVMIRGYANNKKSWEKATIVKKIGVTTYICQYKPGFTCKRHANQIISAETADKSNQHIPNFNLTTSQCHITKNQSVTHPMFCLPISFTDSEWCTEQAGSTLDSEALEEDLEPPRTLNSDNASIEISKEKDYCSVIVPNLFNDCDRDVNVSDLYTECNSSLGNVNNDVDKEANRVSDDNCIVRTDNKVTLENSSKSRDVVGKIYRSKRVSKVPSKFKDYVTDKP